ncbi:MAG: hypothetical protein COA99_02860 [Moraxellaceae bacterium]|nr:MAG: hypothetical protein COA99_02860 [Moraxellaceae bacterium]
MNIKSNVLIAIYLVVSALALFFTWSHIPEYLGHGFIEANKAFWIDALINANSAGKFLSIDILFLAFVCNVWMYIEGRRIGIKYITIYIIVGLLVAISVAFPLFLAAREAKMAKQIELHQSPGLKVADILVLTVLFVLTLGVSIWMY